ncbi:AAA family ATPase [Peptoniphilus sp. oral taxon 386]|uniref:AAA family ATPase n=1 Tax=Peptoniphilus sp. oral taxon 386 TaxID=652713 RepID=UPI0001DA9D1F|nr:AAA family ATPase [Peptoniphilus sp. oral taxon 386]EFI42688.1 tetratricopeptide repeat protein [Peptoniphilus sp. oral taxon 386 str. F0131]
MTKISCRMFGVPSILEDGKDIFIPIGKLSGLVYYILIKKIVSRDEVAGLFWSSSNDERSKVSLRNALHKIRKLFKEEIILSPNKSTLMLNENIEFEIDVEKFSNNPIENLDLYTGEFMKGFYIKDSADFEYWIIEQRNYYKEQFISNIKKKIKNDFDTKNFKNFENEINSLLAVDNFNETAYMYLMKYYKLSGRYDKIINEYYNFQKLMEEELGIYPSDEIETLYNDAIENVNKSKGSNFRDKILEFYDRDYELKIMQENLDNFYNGREYKSILITGESGIGKTVLKKKLLSKNKGRFKIFESQCHVVEKDFLYSPWMKIISAIENELSKNHLKRPYIWDDVLKNLFFDGKSEYQPLSKILENKENFNIDLIYSSIYSVLEILNTDKKILIIIEDIQWADNLSIKLLINFILRMNKNVLFILTKSDESDEKVDRLLATLKDINKLLLIELKRFNRRDVSIIVRKSFENKEISEEDIDDIYEKSKGNSFFLREYIELYKKNEKENLIIPKMQNILQEKFSGLNEKEINILEILSVFYGDATIDNLMKLLDLKAFDVVKSLNFLVKMNVIEEKKKNNEIVIGFVYSAYKEFIYNGLSDVSKKIIHGEIAKILEEELLNNIDITLYIKLKHHYSKANEDVKALKYEVYILNYYLNFSHELFPDLDDYDLSKQVKLFVKNDKALKWIHDVEKEILRVKNLRKNNFNFEEIRKIELLFLYCKGRYLIRGGNYFNGIKVMDRVIKLAIDLKDEKAELLGYKQMAIYGIQINDPNVMLKHIISGIKVARKLKNNSDMGVLYRLYGVYYLMQGNFKSAENLFNKSIELFSNSGGIENSNSISIAADYNYIGEIRNSECNYDEAMQYFKKSIDLCEDTDASCLSIFYINAGKTCFLMNNIEDMKKYFMLSKQIVDRFDSYWKNSVLDAFLALVLFLECDYISSIQYLKNAVAEVKTINNPRDIGIVYFVEAIMAFIIKKQNILELREIKEFLSETADVYYYNAIKYLDANRDRAEIEYLKQNIIC